MMYKSVLCYKRVLSYSVSKEPCIMYFFHKITRNGLSLELQGSSYLRRVGRSHFSLQQGQGEVRSWWGEVRFSLSQRHVVNCRVNSYYIVFICLLFIYFHPIYIQCCVLFKFFIFNGTFGVKTVLELSLFSNILP